MLYCKNCRLVFSDISCCPICGDNSAQPPQPDDICFLTETDPLPAGMLKASLEQNDIPYLSSSSIGAGLAIRAGAMFERIKFYVRYDDLTKAKDLADSMFGSDGSDEAEVYS